MKYNSTYTPNLDLKTTLVAFGLIRQQLLDQIKKIYNFLYISPPDFLEQNSPLLINVPMITRPIWFDSSDQYQTYTLLLSPTNWMRQMIERLNLDIHQGLKTEFKSIWRDLKETPNKTIAKHELIFQVKLNIDEDEIETTRHLSQQIYQIIFEIAKQISTKYKISNIYPPIAEYISSQMMENELPNETFENREIEFSLEKEAYILKSPGAKMFSGHIHSKIPPQIYDLHNFYQIILRDRVNSFVSKVATIALTSNGQQLKDQLLLYQQGQYLSNSFYENLVRQSFKIVEIRIDLSRLAMVLLAKGHIGEVQGGIISHEAKQIKEKYHIDII